MNNIIIYTDKITRRLAYVIDFISQVLESVKIEPRLHNEVNSDVNAIRINYSSATIVNCLKMPVRSCLEEGKNISEFTEFERDLRYESKAFNFDMFSAIFFLLSRSEEYNNNNPDQHGRYRAEESILFRKDLLAEPVIDYWINSFITIINENYGTSIELKGEFTFNSSIDVDHFFAYKHKSLTITLGSFFRDLFKFKFKHVAARFRSKDPFDTFEEIFGLHHMLDLDLKMFVLCSRRSKYDKSLPPENKEFIYRIQRYSDKYAIGIHPSYKAAGDNEQLDNEIKLLESILSSDIKISRQHYILIDFPTTYRALIKAGITHDYSMGYPEKIGFRAGTSRSFKWYDLENEEITSLLIHPFQIMDVSLKNYMQLSPEEAVNATGIIIDNVKAVKGNFTLIWHNSSFSDLHGWGGWKEVYTDILNLAK